VGTAAGREVKSKFGNAVSTGAAAGVTAAGARDVDFGAAGFGAIVFVDLGLPVGTLAALTGPVPTGPFPFGGGVFEGDAAAADPRKSKLKFGVSGEGVVRDALAVAGDFKFTFDEAGGRT